ncbi:MAG: DUF4351 domain-containing protein [Blastocatellia bacterium]|nr:DUF4351 domain-containing protein [Blastocatellia bacterium]
MKYDIVLKELFQATSNRLVQLLVGENLQVVEQLNIEFAEVATRRADLVMRLSNGRIYHLELQSIDDEEMVLRMLEYYWLIFKQYRQIPLQQVIYVGNKVFNGTTSISHPNLQFSYQLIDIRSFPADFLLESNFLSDNLLAILCRSSDTRFVIAQILEKISLLPRHDREDALTKLFILSGLRNFETLILQELNSMSTSFDIRDNSFLSGIFQQGHQEGINTGLQQGLQQGLQEEAATILQKLLERKFGTLPQSVVDKIKLADASTLETWAINIFDINSLEEFLTL